MGLSVGGALRTPVAHTVHGPVDGVPGLLYEQASAVAPNVGLISISLNQRKPKPGLNWIANCPNALDFDLYPYAPHRGDYLLFLGRMAPDKGAHRAVRTAIEAGLPLKLAGKMREPLELAYFDEFVRAAPELRIEYLGEVSHGEKVELLQHARATLFPIEWEEPFGLVMIESMACGTPVIAIALGRRARGDRAGPWRRDRRRLGRRGRGARARRTRSRRSRAAPTPRSASSRSGWSPTTSRRTRQLLG